MGKDLWMPVKAPAETLARMAQVVGVTPEQLEEAGRADAADELRALPPLAEPERSPTIEELAADLARVKAQNAELRQRFEEYLRQHGRHDEPERRDEAGRERRDEAG